MIESIKGVRNPLTIIAIFAGLAEISGTGILPFIVAENQATYIWFLMLFPCFLVALFFLTLNFNPRVLYSPSDFRDEANYMKIFQPSSMVQRLFKIEEEIAEEAEVPAPVQEEPQVERPVAMIKSKAEITEMMQANPRARYQLAESLVIDRLSRELQIHPQRDLAIRNMSRDFMYDAVFKRKDGITIVEVKFFSSGVGARRIRETVSRIQSSIQALPVNMQRNAHIILAIAYDMPEDRAQQVKQEIEALVANFSVPIEVRMFFLPDLLKEAEIE